MSRLKSATRAGESLRHLLPWVVAVALLPAAARAQDRPAAADSGARRGVALRDVVGVTLARSPDIRTAARYVDLQRGAVLAATGQFDPQLHSSVGSMRDNSVQLVRPDTSALVAQATTSLSYLVGVDKVFRSGIVVSPQVGITRTDILGIPGLATSRATANLSVLVPLWNDRLGAVTGAAQRAAENDYEASALQLQHASAASVYTAVVAYWDYVAALRRLAVFVESEARAKRMADETAVLVKAEERAAADLKQVQGNVAAKRVSRISGEQGVIEARHALGLAMGLSPAEIAALPAAATDFPRATMDSATTAAGATTWDPQRLIDQALRSRADLAAAGRTTRAAEVFVSAAQSDLKPRFDLAVGLGYVGLEQGSGLQRFFSPLYRNVPGVNTSVELRYHLPTGNAGARGRAMQNTASYEQLRIAELDLARHITSGVLVADEALRHSRASLAQSEEAVALSQTSVESEMRKFKLGVATLFDVIQAQDALTNARIGEIAGRRTFAVAIASLRYETGTLVVAEGQSVSVDPERLLTPP